MVENNKMQTAVTPLSLPKGGGAISSGDIFAGSGPDGSLSLSLAFPVSPGRGYAPDLTVGYHSSSGNGPFGMGWALGFSVIGRRTSKGVPAYTDEDVFIGPDGEVLLPALIASGNAPDVRETDTLHGHALHKTYTVTRYQPRIESAFAKIEFWNPAQSAAGQLPFWVVFSPDGQQHLFGKSQAARISDPAAPSKIAQWLLEESVSPTGEHILYRYQSEDETGCDPDEKERHPHAVAQRYLTMVLYGNTKSEAGFFLLQNDIPAVNEWLFEMVLDYGARTCDPDKQPPYKSTGQWPARKDCFSKYDDGFDVRTRRLCRQALMFHRIGLLQGNKAGQDEPALVRRLLFTYVEDKAVSTLTSVRTLAYEPDGTPKMLPPTEFEYSRPVQTYSPQWRTIRELGNFNLQQPYQLVDLFGEGITGILYQDGNVWQYREPVSSRDKADENVDDNTPAFGPAVSLSSIPLLRESASLIDADGDGKLEWMVTAPGVQGYYRIEAEERWTPFIPLRALPTEFFHPSALLSDVLGTGEQDLVLIGPQSVRVYPHLNDAWEQALNVKSDNSLPVPNRDARSLVVFSDMVGSGQQHLAEIRANGVTCWPNLGRGRFGAPLSLPGFSQPEAEFNPVRVFLADLDGSGTTDIIYALSDRILVYYNRSGNSFSVPRELPLPEEVRFDNTCSLQVADIQGLGVSSLLLTVPHLSPQHWLVHLESRKPWLLCTINNNMGGQQDIQYRSSVQFWLDEKKRLSLSGQSAASYLPFPIHCVWRVTNTDEISGNVLINQTRYRHAVWDGKEREFRGFGQIDAWDTHTETKDSTATHSAPLLTRNWYYTGNPDVDKAILQEFWQTETSQKVRPAIRYTDFDSSLGRDKPCAQDSVTPKQLFWMLRATKGIPLRSETYACDASYPLKADFTNTAPYSVTESRVQLRRIPTRNKEEPAVFPLTVETRTWRYEQIAADPHCSQRVTAALDAYGSPLREFSIAYPRRDISKMPSPYPDDLPGDLFTSSFDDQQNILRISGITRNWHHLTDNDEWRLRLPRQTRHDEWTGARGRAPEMGITLELLLGEDRESIIDTLEAHYCGQQHTYYTAGDGQAPLERPTMQALTAFVETAVYDDDALSAYTGVWSAQETAAQLTAGGYQRVPRLYAVNGETDVWVAHTGYTSYGPADQFWKPVAQRGSLLTGKTTWEWDAHSCAPVRVRDASGAETRAVYDYRFITPYEILDSNGNTHHATFNSLGQVVSTRFWGTELINMSSSQAGTVIHTGYSSATSKPFSLPGDTVEQILDALSKTVSLPVAQAFFMRPDSWMPTAPDAAGTAKPRGILELRRSQLEVGSSLEEFRVWLDSLERLPPHILTLTTDCYDDDQKQQVRQQVSFFDGFGRTLQVSVRHEDGPARALDVNYGLQRDASGSALETPSSFRWAVTGLTEYDNKGLPVRVYQPYYLNNWRWVRHSGPFPGDYADTHVYDPTSREILVFTAKGYLRRVSYYPWFTVCEDENDTAGEMPANTQQSSKEAQL